MPGAGCPEDAASPVLIRRYTRLGKVLGAIYLDNRFQAGAFDVDALAFMENFADQAGIALYNARLVQDLESSKQALEVEREKVEELNEKLSEDLELRTSSLSIKTTTSSNL